MGYMRHHAIIVTSWDEEALAIAFSEAKATFGGAHVTERVWSKTNYYLSFMVAPDGSKESWADSEDGDRKRIRYKEFLHSLKYEDGSSPVKWVEVFYGDDDGQSMVTACDDDYVSTDDSYVLANRLFVDVDGCKNPAVKLVPRVPISGGCV